MLETAIVLPCIILFVVGVMEYGRYFMTQHLLSLAAHDACRYAVAHTEEVTIGGTTYENSSDRITAAFHRFAGTAPGHTMLKDQELKVYLASDEFGTWRSDWTVDENGYVNLQPGDYVCVQVKGWYRVAMPTLIILPQQIWLDVKVIMQPESTN